MGKISDALDKFQKQDGGDSNDKKVTKNIVSVPHPVERGNASNIAEKSRIQPIKPSKIADTLISAIQPQSFESEQFRVLKSKLLFPNSGIAPRSILITSALPGEGKSFVSSNTAISFAQNINDHVLLVDCDVRSPSIHKFFGFESAPQGLTDYLTQDIPLSSILLKTDINKLTILPAGTIPNNPAELLSSHKMSILVNELIERYRDRYIIIDSPPMNLTSETNVLAKLVEKILVVVDFTKTSRDTVMELIESFEKEKVAGIILNKYDSLDITYGYQKYHKNNKYYPQV